ncbi:hypothetical protein HD806DRAFT_203022 [Xylariaceae sp. AK1471]|nr:hypothetical protein HD806DRAFT_203022 [Xylariaceae sp. AK1471]
MSKITMEHAVAWLGEAIPSSLWSIVRWTTFFFKLVSLAFAVPIIGLIVFDFCLWLWRLYSPSRPDPPRPSRLPRDHIQQPSRPPSSNIASSSAIDLETELRANERRSAYGTPKDNR